MSSLTCKEFLAELNDYLDEAIGPDMRHKLEAHANACHHCYVVFDGAKKTIKVFKGIEPQPLPADIQDRLMQALMKRMAAKQS